MTDAVPTTIDETLGRARRLLAAAPFAPPTREATLLLGHVLGWNEARVLARGDQAVPADAARRFAALLERRLSGEPVAYLLGEREFYGRPFAVDRRVLIPRPETEHLVEEALAALATLDGERRRERSRPRPRVLDVGTGSGCLAVTLALEAPGARVTACDLSPGALAVAAGNARHLGAPVLFFAADLAAPARLADFDLVVSNPPYIDPGTAASLSPEVVEHEPGLALFAEGRGRGVLRRLLRAAGGPRPTGLPPGGRLILEVGHDQAAEVVAAAAASGLQTERVTRDYSGIERIVRLRRPS